jgi:flagellar motor switch protein FliN/FliY
MDMEPSEPSIEPLEPAELEPDQAHESTVELAASSLDAMHEVPVRVRAVLGRAQIAVGELVRMKPGMVVALDRRVGEAIDIFVNDRLIAKGEVVLIDNALGVTLTEIVRSEQ